MKSSRERSKTTLSNGLGHIYIYSVNEPSDARAVMDDIDRRIAAVSAFPGRNFKQRTGNDSKALMKAFLPAIVGHVPDKMVQCIAAFLDFCYLARRSSHTRTTLLQMEDALTRFHTLRVVFEEVGVRPDGFCLPRQHALMRYVQCITLFGSPNGLCTSITESRHITAVKRPWRRSSKNNPLLQILLTTTRLSKLAAARVLFVQRGLLEHDIITQAQVDSGLIEVGSDGVAGGSGPQDLLRDDEDDVSSFDGPAVDSFVRMSQRAVFTRSPWVVWLLVVFFILSDSDMTMCGTMRTR